MTQDISVGLVFADLGNRKVTVSGAADAPAFPLIEAEFRQAGTNIGWDPTSGPVFVLEPVKPVDIGESARTFILLTPAETMADLRTLVGPNDYAVAVELPGFGGEGDIFSWVLQDLLPLGRVLLEVYGAVEVGHRLTAVIQRSRAKETRALADYWVREGAGTPPQQLIGVVQSRYWWTTDDIDTQLGLGREEATRLMNLCGYRWSAEFRAYYPPTDRDAVN
jgi:hypothetical protein